MADAAFSSPKVSEVEGITRTADPALRNLQITQAYFDLSTALAARTGASANWCTFAVWASKQAGQSIRKEDLRRKLESALFAPGAAGPAADELVHHARRVDARRDRTDALSAVRKAIGLQPAVDRVSDAVARGNLKVFAEIGRAFAQFSEAFLADETPNFKELESFCTGFQPGDPPEGQRLLQSAFGSYYRSFFTADPKVKAELILRANISIGLHEQMRLQPEITEALNAALVNSTLIASRVLRAIFPFSIWFSYWIRFGNRLLGRQTMLEVVLQQYITTVQGHLRRVITDTLMTLRIPPETILHLGSDLTENFPKSLATLTDPELLALIAAHDPTPDSPAASGARDWANLNDRLHFIIDLFRSHQEAPAIFAPPFEPEQTTAIKAGRIPSGKL